MRKLSMVLLVILVATLAGAQTFNATLSGSREVGSVGDPDGRGLAVLTLAGTTLSYYLWVKDVDLPTAMQIQSGGAGQGGAVSVEFNPTFSIPAAGVFVARGSVTVDAAKSQEILAAPSAFYVNVRNTAFPNGAMRGQLLGDGAALFAFSSTLRGTREVGTAGDSDGSGYAAAVIDGTTVYYYIWVKDIATPTLAHIHSGTARQSGPVVIDFAPTFAGGVAFGSVSADAAVVAGVIAAPEKYYFNVHNGEFPGGAVRGQLGATETNLHFPVLARNAGSGTSSFKSNMRVLNLNDEDALFYVEWYPKGAAGATGPAAVSKQVVVAQGEAVYDDVIGTLFGANDRGAVRIVSAFALRAVANTFNDQRPSGGGTFGQFLEGLGIGSAFSSGALVYNSSRPRADALDFRTNAGFFNPNPFAVDVTFNVRKPDGTAVGEPSVRTLAPYSNDLALFHQIIPGIPGEQRTLANFYVTYTASAPVFVFSSVVDNKTDDGFHQPATQVASSLTAPVGANNAPNGTITAPTDNVSITAGQAVSFAASASDPDGDNVTVQWDFGDSTTANVLVPGSHTFANPGTFTVSFTATDPRGLTDPTPDTRTISVAAAVNNPPNGTITAPAGPVAISAGQSVAFAGTATDPDGDALTVLWDFGDGVTASVLAPGNHTFANAGTFTVTFTATDARGLADPTPDTRVITVTTAAATLSELQAQIFTPLCAGCHGGTQGLFLNAGATFSNVVNVPSTQQPSWMLVKPGDPDNSYLYRKVVGSPTFSITGRKMPPGGSLSQAQIDKIRGWILAGAQND